VARFINVFEQFSLGCKGFVAYLAFELIGLVSFFGLLCLLLLFDFGPVKSLLLFLVFLTGGTFIYLCWRFLLVCLGSWLWLLDGYLLDFVLFVAIAEKGVHEMIFIVT
jgi:hypothetical protein